MKKVVISCDHPIRSMSGINGSTPRVVDSTGYSYLVEYPENWDLSMIVDRYSFRHLPNRDRPNVTARLWDDRDRLM
jgi:hypothetical protein